MGNWPSKCVLSAIRRRSLDRATTARIQGELQRSDWDRIKWEKRILTTRDPSAACQDEESQGRTLTDHPSDIEPVGGARNWPHHMAAVRGRFA